MMFRRAQTGDALDLFDQMVGDLYDQMDVAGAQIVDDWQQRLSVDVEYSRGPRGGIVIIRSQPGESPRRETHRLYESIQSRVEIDADTVLLEVDTDVFYAGILEEKLDRPHAEPTFEASVDTVLDAAVQAIEHPR